MTTVRSGERMFYISEHSDEMLPCVPTLEGWAEWLSKPDEQWQHEIPADGENFEAYAILFHDDIIARKVDGDWTFSAIPGDEAFVAVRFAKGLGWQADNIIGCWDGETMEQALRTWFAENDADRETEEYIAFGTNESGWRLTYRAGPPPSLDAERAQ